MEDKTMKGVFKDRISSLVFFFGMFFLLVTAYGHGGEKQEEEGTSSKIKGGKEMLIARDPDHGHAQSRVPFVFSIN